MLHTSSFASFLSLLTFITSANVDQLSASNGANCSICESVKAADGSICSLLKNYEKWKYSKRINHSFSQQHIHSGCFNKCYRNLIFALLNKMKWNLIKKFKTESYRRRKCKTIYGSNSFHYINPEHAIYVSE